MGDRKIPTRIEIQEQVQELTANVLHAKIECEISDSTILNDKTIEEEIQTHLEHLKRLATAITEYSLALKEKLLSIKECKQRDSGISLGDRSSALLRDSFPIQESRQDHSGNSLTDSEIGATCSASEHSDHSDIETGEDITSSEQHILDRQGTFSANRRPAKDRKKILSEAIPEEHH